MKPGIVSLDIDGTITNEFNSVSEDVVHYLSAMASSGWAIIFITGRTFQWSHRVLSFFSFPYVVAVQNGAILLEMPSKKILEKKYIDSSIFPKMDEICKDEASDYVLYAGFQFQDRCFYRPSKFSGELLQYLKSRSKTIGEAWIPVLSYKDIGIEAVPSIKCFGNKDDAIRIAYNIEKKLGLHAPVNRDPFNSDYYIVQATHPDVNKGYALAEYKKLLGRTCVVIAAGDDNNDRSMLAEADVKIVMSDAPQDMQDSADLVAPPATRQGIITGLQKAIQIIKKMPA